MSTQHHVIIIPGLGDSENRMRFIEHHWNWDSYGLHLVIHPMRWHDQTEPEFLPKLQRLTTLIKKMTKKEDIVSLIGTSAGGSAALNAFIENKKDIHCVVNVCGRLRSGPLTGYRSFFAKTKSSPSFAQSILLCEEKESTLTPADKKRIMTVHAKFGDELVPRETAIIEGATNIEVPMIEHGLSIVLGLTIFSKPIIEFVLASQ